MTRKAPGKAPWTKPLFDGLIVLAGTIFVFWYLADFENSHDPSRSMPWMLALLYDYGGKWLACGIMAVIGIAQIAMAFRQRSEEEGPGAEQVKAVVRALDNPVSDQEALTRLMPLIVPANYSTLGFPSPFERLPAPEFILTAVILRESQAMTYLTRDRAERWAAQGISWKEKAIANLRAADGGQPITHSRQDETGKVVWAAMMTPDGLGTSRVLCTEALREIFPEGYWIAIPERSMGVAISKSLQGASQEEAVDLVKKCYEHGTTPNSPRLFEPEALGG